MCSSEIKTGGVTIYRFAYIACLLFDPMHIDIPKCHGLLDKLMFVDNKFVYFGYALLYFFLVKKQWIFIIAKTDPIGRCVFDPNWRCNIALILENRVY